MKRIRIEYDGALYHVTQRGNNHEAIFTTNADKKTYLRLLKTYNGKFDFQLLGYALMDNHYHLLVQAKADPLSKVMHSINTTYSRYYNKEYDRSGHVFSSRYAAALVLDEKYLFAVLRYLHWNPVRAGISHSAADYKWSSDYAYRHNDNSFVNIDFILKTFNADRDDAILAYKRLMMIPGEEGYENSPLIGSQPSTEEVKLKLKTDKKLDVKENIEAGSSRKPLSEILSETGADDNQRTLIKSGSRIRLLKPLKAAFIQSAVKEGYTYREISRYISISVAAVSKLVQ